jgi:hypothetical protein
MRAGKARAAERGWRNDAGRPKARRCAPRRAEPSILKYVGPVIRAVVRALWRYISR